ncbi:hypothetical protein RND71_043761 [Anisodus tanguticus]|uniref:Uncharacterized protein n=1 Tax=Anisodus tanguticus TaxID=243964 RepID=A0AAE1QP89_9SOLA|nr:hypothetical protein RND71_043761 [Anisodus tanguticus]
MEELLMGLVSQLAEKEDAILCSDVRDKLFGPMNFSRRDLAALNIMRGRDNGLPDYNTAREAFGLPKLNWTQILPPSDWYKYEIAVMIGGGIGVTPYASILNDLVFGTSTNR